MFFVWILGQTGAETITNQTVAVAVLVMILGGLGWLVKQIFSMLPSLMDRMDKQEERRNQAMEKLAAEMKSSNGDLAGRIEKAIDRMTAEFRLCLCEVQESLEEAHRMQAAYIASLKSDGIEPGDNGKANREAGVKS